MAMSESRRRKLQMLLRSRAKGLVGTGEEFLAAHGHTGVNRGLANHPAVTPPTERALDLPSACGGEESGSGSRYWLIRRELLEVDPQADPCRRQYEAVLRGARQAFNELEASAELCHAANAGPGDLLFMDTETCGLGGTMIFLVGLMSYQGESLVFEQMLARDYSEESAILDAFARRYEQAGVLVTFNGKSFDMTQIRDRWAFHGVEMPWQDPPHLDLLHESRRRWKGQLRSFKLQSLERTFCGRRRVGDIPGAAIPDAYHQFVRTGDARRMRDILHHNLLDLLTMAQLVTIMLTGCDPVVGPE